MPQDYVPHPGVLRGQDYGITFLRSSKTGQRNEAKYAKYSKATATRQYFALGGSAADWRYELLKYNTAMFVSPMLICNSERTPFVRHTHVVR